MTIHSLNEKVILVCLIILTGCGQHNELVVADGSTFLDGSVVDEDGSVVDEDGSVVDEDSGMTGEDSGMTGEDSGTATMTDVDEDGVTVEDGDCDDNDAERYPDAEEVCDGKDNDCDGSTDEDLEVDVYADADGDGYAADSASSTGTVACSATLSPGETTLLGDCDDAASSTYPGAPELCDSVDNDCDGSTDEGVLIYVYSDADGDGHAGSSLSGINCVDKTEDDYLEATDCDDGDANSYPEATEVCDGKDNDCDESTDEDLEVDVYADVDGDGYALDGASSLRKIACSATPSSGETTLLGDCDDATSSTYPGAPELCDSVDNDCNSTVDDNIVNAISLSEVDGLSGIHNAIGTTVDGGEITVCLGAGSYTGSAGITITGNKTVNIVASEPGVILNGEGTKRVIDIQGDGYTLDVSLTGITIQNGATASSETGSYAYYGGGLRSIKAELTIHDCTFKSNTAAGAFGGGAYVFPDTLPVEFENTLFESNVATAGAGGGLRLNTSTTGNPEVTLNNMTFKNNTAKYYGAGASISVSDATVTLDGEFSANESTDLYGGGLHVQALAGAVVNINADVKDNFAAPASLGGGIYLDVDDSEVSITGSFHNNESSGGGGLYVEATTAADVTIDAEFDENISYGDGGGFEVNANASTVTIVDNTFGGNESIGFGGAGYIDASNASTIEVAGAFGYGSGGLPNSANIGGALYVKAKDTNTQVTLSGDYSGNESTLEGGALNIEATVRAKVIVGGDFGENAGAHNSAGTAGGAIYAVASTRAGLTIANSSFQFNEVTTGEGGGAYIKANSSSDIKIINTTFSNHDSLTDGGGLYIDANSAAVNITSCGFENNTAGISGGGAYIKAINQSALSIENTAFSLNEATTSGGGAHLFIFGLGTTAAITGSSTSFSSNQANDGAGLYVDVKSSAALTINDASFEGNVAVGSGGGAYLSADSSATADITGSSTLFSNNAANDGGGLYVDVKSSAALTINDASFEGNVAVDSGGGFVLNADGSGTTVSLSSSTVENNSGDYGGGADVSASNSAYVKASACTFGGLSLEQGNKATYSAGIRLSAATLASIEVTESTFGFNRSRDQSGGLFLQAYDVGTSVGLTQNTFTNNSVSDGDGGGINAFISEASVAIADSSFVSNSAGDYGGGMYLMATGSGTAPFVSYNILDNSNTAGLGGAKFYSSASGSAFINFSSNTTDGSTGVTCTGSTSSTYECN